MIRDRERYIAHSLFEDTGREMFCELFGPLHVTERERRELEYRLAPHLMGGGTVFALGHRIPNGVPIDVCRTYVRLGREMLGPEPDAGTGWARMAF